MKTTGVIIARFQTPLLHEGHFDLINYVRQRHNKVVIVLGVSSVKGSTRNPLDFYTRERMVKKEFPEIVVLPLADCRNDATWSANLDSLLSITFNNEHVILYGSRDSFIPYYSGKNEVQEIPQTKDFSGTSLRDQICDRVMDSEDFRCGIIYANYNRYPSVYATLDVALFKDDYTRILLGRRNSEGKWRLPGGFSDPTDNDFESAALRELHEECGQIEVDEMRYEKSFKVNDWRYKQETDKIITLMFSCNYIYGEIKGSDDLDEAEWIPLNKIPEMIENYEIVDEHFPQLQFLVNKYCKVLSGK
jgi:bifunctional NMN adenylyltransferase/nudix hydrolase